jgi:hypothetical protein
MVDSIKDALLLERDEEDFVRLGHGDAPIDNHRPLRLSGGNRIKVINSV